MIEKIYNYLIARNPFKEVRYYTPGKKEYHEGQDFTSEKFKRQKLYSCFNGNIDTIKLDHTYYGKQVTIKLTLYAGVIYVSFCHLSIIAEDILKNINTNQYIVENTYIGNMGNTGNSWTKGRHVTKKEQEDPEALAGVHLHYMIYEKDIKKGIETDIMKDIRNKIGIDKLDYLYQWNKLFYNPLKIHAYINAIGG